MPRAAEPLGWGTVEPWTNGLRLAWVPTLSYFERRFEILRALERRGVLHAFRVDDDDSVAARLEEAHHELRIRSDGLGASEFGSDGRSTVLREAVAEVLNALEPRRFRALSAFYQHMAPIEGDYDGRRRHFAAVCAAGVGASLGATDCAVLIDGSREGADYQAEFGIVDRTELRMRLRGEQVGRLGGAHRFQGELPADLPEVAMYMESNWTLQGLTDHSDDKARWVLEAWDRLTGLANGNALQVANVLAEENTEPQTTTRSS